MELIRFQQAQINLLEKQLRKQNLLDASYDESSAKLSLITDDSETDYGSDICMIDPLKPVQNTIVERDENKDENKAQEDLSTYELEVAILLCNDAKEKEKLEARIERKLACTVCSPGTDVHAEEEEEPS